MMRIIKTYNEITENETYVEHLINEIDDLKFLIDAVESVIKMGYDETWNKNKWSIEKYEDFTDIDNLNNMKNRLKMKEKELQKKR